MHSARCMKLGFMVVVETTWTRWRYRWMPNVEDAVMRCQMAKCPNPELGAGPRVYIGLEG